MELGSAAMASSSTGGSQIEIVDCVVRNYAADGIYIHVSARTVATISNVIASNNQIAGFHLATAGNGRLARHARSYHGKQ
jgi:hypothetical protein